MPDRSGPELVDLYQREGRARHLLGAAAGTDEGTGEGGLAGAEIALQSDDIANFG